MQQLTVPDIGDYRNIPVIEVLVRAGDQVSVEQSLVTLESDKATMDVPSTLAGTIREVLVKPGDLVSQGSLIAHIEFADAGSADRTTDNYEGAGAAAVDTSVSDAHARAHVTPTG